MNAEPSLLDLYRAHGFAVTSHLQELIDSYGETEVVSPVDPQRGMRFYPRCEIQLRRDDSEDFSYEYIGNLLGSPVAPVGQSYDDDELMLTKDGRLVGVSENCIHTWGPKGCDWRVSMAAYLAGRKERYLGNLEIPQPPELPLAELYRERGYTLTPHLLALIETYGETARAPAGAESVIDEDGRVDWNLAPKETIQFCDRNDIEVYSLSAAHSCVVRSYGKSVAPVGRTKGMGIILFLTEDGRLVGDDRHDAMMTWGPDGCDWRTSIAARLAGEPARDLGVA